MIQLNFSGQLNTAPMEAPQNSDEWHLFHPFNKEEIFVVLKNLTYTKYQQVTSSEYPSNFFKALVLFIFLSFYVDMPHSMFS